MALTVLNPALRRVSLTMGAARQYPIFPLSVLLLVLIIPGIFANQIAPHDPTDGSPSQRLLAPVWQGDEARIQEVVEEISRENRLYEITLRDAARRIGIGRATIVDGTDGSEVKVGDRVRIVITQGGSWKHMLGTDKLGRDVFSRILHGARISLTVALVSIFLGAFVGISLGLIAGYFGGNTDHIIMRLVDVKLAVPSILLALVLASVMNPGFISVIVVIAVVLWARYARMVRGEVLRVRELDFIARARVAGASNLRIVARHVFPNIVNSVVVLATLEIGQVILFEAALSFLGVGIPRPNPAWGLMVADGRDLVATAWWVAFFPGLAILLTVLSMNLFGDWLRDKLDPKLRNI